MDNILKLKSRKSIITLIIFKLVKIKIPLSNQGYNLLILTNSAEHDSTVGSRQAALKADWVAGAEAQLLHTFTSHTVRHGHCGYATWLCHYDVTVGTLPWLDVIIQDKLAYLCKPGNAIIMFLLYLLNVFLFNLHLNHPLYSSRWKVFTTSHLLHHQYENFYLLFWRITFWYKQFHVSLCSNYEVCFKNAFIPYTQLHGANNNKKRERKKTSNNSKVFQILQLLY